VSLTAVADETKLGAVARRTATAAALVAAAATALALASAWHSGRTAWDRLDAGRASYAPLSATARRRLPFERAGVPGAVLDFYARYLARGDRVYFEVGRGADQAAFEAAGRFGLLPATVTSSLEDATVVLSYDADPRRLHVSFLTQRRDGRRRVYISRIALP
jgi:hypothetical protein